MSDIHAKDVVYFAKLRAAIDGDELAAFVHDALAAVTAKPEVEYLFHLLDKGSALKPGYDWNARRYPRVKPEPQDPWRGGQITVHRDAPFDDYCEWMRARHPRKSAVGAAGVHGAIQNILGRTLFRGEAVRLPKRIAAKERMLLIGPLADCRAAFDAHTGFAHDWDGVSTNAPAGVANAEDGEEDGEDEI